MYLWRNLPEGQLLAVLRWLQGRRDLPRPTVAETEVAAGAEKAAAPAPR